MKTPQRFCFTLKIRLIQTLYFDWQLQMDNSFVYKFCIDLSTTQEEIRFSSHNIKLLHHRHQWQVIFVFNCHRSQKRFLDRFQFCMEGLGAASLICSHIYLSCSSKNGFFLSYNWSELNNQAQAKLDSMSLKPKAYEDIYLPTRSVAEVASSTLISCSTQTNAIIYCAKVRSSIFSFIGVLLGKEVRYIFFFIEKPCSVLPKL